MRILLTVTNDLSHDQRMHRTAATLHAAGHEVTLVGRKLPDSPPLPEKPYRQLRLRCRYHRGKRFYAEFNWRLWWALRRKPYDAVCSVDLDTLLAGYFLTRTGDRHHYWIYDAHEWFSETPEVYPRPLIRRAWRTLGRWLVPLTDVRYTVAPILAEKLAQDYGAPFATVRNTPYSLKIANKEILDGVILYQGMLNPGRGLEAAITALASLPDCRLWLVGSGPEETNLRTLAARQGVADRVRFVGFVPPEQLHEYTRRAWLGLNLLEATAPSYYFSLANKSLDYIQIHLPSIQMNFPEYRAINERYGCYTLLDELGARPLVRCVRELQQDASYYQSLVDGCREAARELCWEREREKLLEIY